MSTTNAERHVPPWRAKSEKPPTYLIRAGSVIEREEFEAELAGVLRAGQVWPGEWKEAFRSGVENLLEDKGEATRLADLYDAAQAEQLAALAEGRDVTPQAKKEAATVAEAVEILTEHWPEFSSLVSRDARRRALMPAVAFRHFCVGWENIEIEDKALEFQTGPDRCVSNEILGKIPAMELRSAGLLAYQLLYGRGEAKNSDALSKSGADQKISK